LAVVLSVLLRYTDSDYPFGIFKLFYHLSPVFSCVRVVRSLVICVMFCRLLFVLLVILMSVFFDLRLLISTLVSSVFVCYVIQLAQFGLLID